MIERKMATEQMVAAMLLDATFKGMGRQKIEEICVYETKDGKIVKEQFFF